MADLDKLEAKIDSLTETIGALNSAVKTGFASVNEKLTKLQESIYDLVRKTQAPQHAEEFRESLPDPPKKRSEFAR
jgi:SMC interacting uncharacterized protein involved in chromosome segregation